MVYKLVYESNKSKIIRNSYLTQMSLLAKRNLYIYCFSTMKNILKSWTATSFQLGEEASICRLIPNCIIIMWNEMRSSFRHLPILTRASIFVKSHALTCHSKTVVASHFNSNNNQLILRHTLRLKGGKRKVNLTIKESAYL